MAAAACGPHGPGLLIFAAIVGAIRIRPVSARDPLPCIAGHVAYAVWARAGRMRIDCCCRVVPGFVLRLVFVRKLTFPGISPRIRAARGLFPLCLGRQALAAPGAVSSGAVPWHFDGGVVGVGCVRDPALA